MLRDKLKRLADRIIPARLKPYAKAVAPGVATLAGIAVQWLWTGTYDQTELTTTITGLGATVLTFLVPNRQPA